MTIRNAKGGDVLHASEPFPKDPHLRAVLCSREGGDFVAYLENLSDSKRVGRPVYCLGRYRDNLNAAWDAHSDRCAEYGAPRPTCPEDLLQHITAEIDAGVLERDAPALPPAAPPPVPFKWEGPVWNRCGEDEECWGRTLYILGVPHHCEAIKVHVVGGLQDATRDPYGRLDDVRATDPNGPYLTVELPEIEPGNFVLHIYPHCD